MQIRHSICLQVQNLRVNCHYKFALCRFLLDEFRREENNFLKNKEIISSSTWAVAKRENERNASKDISVVAAAEEKEKDKDLWSFVANVVEQQTLLNEKKKSERNLKKVIHICMHACKCFFYSIQKSECIYACMQMFL